MMTLEVCVQIFVSSDRYISYLCLDMGHLCLQTRSALVCMLAIFDKRFNCTVHSSSPAEPVVRRKQRSTRSEHSLISTLLLLLTGGRPRGLYNSSSTILVSGTQTMDEQGKLDRDLQIENPELTLDSLRLCHLIFETVGWVSTRRNVVVGGEKDLPSSDSSS
jgi:hypothetical protein